MKTLSRPPKATDGSTIGLATMLKTTLLSQIHEKTKTFPFDQNTKDNMLRSEYWLVGLLKLVFVVFEDAVRQQKEYAKKKGYLKFKKRLFFMKINFYLFCLTLKNKCFVVLLCVCLTVLLFVALFVVQIIKMYV